MIYPFKKNGPFDDDTDIYYTWEEQDSRKRVYNMTAVFEPHGEVQIHEANSFESVYFDARTLYAILKDYFGE